MPKPRLPMMTINQQFLAQRAEERPRSTNTMLTTSMRAVDLSRGEALWLRSYLNRVRRSLKRSSLLEVEAQEGVNLRKKTSSQKLATRILKVS